MLSPQPHDSTAAEPVRLLLQDHELVPLPEGALWWPAKRTLIVSDLHLEKGAAFAQRGQLLPPYDTLATLAVVRRLMASLPVECVISLGDSFHTPKSAERLEETVQGVIRELTAKCDWVWVEGNHDPDPPQCLGGRAAKALYLGRLVFRHEPTGERGEIAGHLHPCARISSRGGRSLRRRCFVSNGEALILPAMGAFTGGLNVLDPAFMPALGAERQVLMLGERRVYAIGADRLRPDRSGRANWRL